MQKHPFYRKFISCLSVSAHCHRWWPHALTLSRAHLPPNPIEMHLQPGIRALMPAVPCLGWRGGARSERSGARSRTRGGVKRGVRPSVQVALREAQGSSWPRAVLQSFSPSRIISPTCGLLVPVRVSVAGEVEERKPGWQPSGAGLQTVRFVPRLHTCCRTP